MNARERIGTHLLKVEGSGCPYTREGNDGDIFAHAHFGHREGREPSAHERLFEYIFVLSPRGVAPCACATGRRLIGTAQALDFTQSTCRRELLGF